MSTRKAASKPLPGARKAAHPPRAKRPAPSFEDPPVRWARKWARAFLRALALCGNKSEACRLAKVGRRTFYEYTEESAEFVTAVADALDEYADKLELEADRRAKEGWDEPVFYQGMECGYVRKFSDTLLITRLKAVRPTVYRERSEITGAGGVPLFAAPPIPLDPVSPAMRPQEPGE